MDEKKGMDSKKDEESELSVGDDEDVKINSTGSVLFNQNLTKRSNSLYN